MAFVDDYGTGTDDTFRRRVVVALTKAATQVIGEAKGVMSDAKLALRHTYAVRVISNPQAFVDNVPFVLASAGVTAATVDTALVTTLVSQWDKLAGVKSTD